MPINPDTDADNIIRSLMTVSGHTQEMHDAIALINRLRGDRMTSNALIGRLEGAINQLLTDYRTEGCPDPGCGVCKKSKAAEDSAHRILEESLRVRTTIITSEGNDG